MPQKVKVSKPETGLKAAWQATKAYDIIHRVSPEERELKPELLRLAKEMDGGARCNDVADPSWLSKNFEKITHIFFETRNPLVRRGAFMLISGTAQTVPELRAKGMMALHKIYLDAREINATSGTRQDYKSAAMRRATAILPQCTDEFYDRLVKAAHSAGALKDLRDFHARLLWEASYDERKQRRLEPVLDKIAAAIARNGEIDEKTRVEAVDNLGGYVPAVLELALTEKSQNVREAAEREIRKAFPLDISQAPIKLKSAELAEKLVDKLDDPQRAKSAMLLVDNILEMRRLTSLDYEAALVRLAGRADLKAESRARVCDFLLDNYEYLKGPTRKRFHAFAKEGKLDEKTSNSLFLKMFAGLEEDERVRIFDELARDKPEKLSGLLVLAPATARNFETVASTAVAVIESATTGKEARGAADKWLRDWYYAIPDRASEDVNQRFLQIAKELKLSDYLTVNIMGNKVAELPENERNEFFCRLGRERPALLNYLWHYAEPLPPSEMNSLADALLADRKIDWKTIGTGLRSNYWFLEKLTEKPLWSARLLMRAGSDEFFEKELPGQLHAVSPKEMVPAVLQAFAETGNGKAKDAFVALLSQAEVKDEKDFSAMKRLLDEKHAKAELVPKILGKMVKYAPAHPEGKLLHEVARISSTAAFNEEFSEDIRKECIRASLYLPAIPALMFELAELFYEKPKEELVLPVLSTLMEQQYFTSVEPVAMLVSDAVLCKAFSDDARKKSFGLFLELLGKNVIKQVPGQLKASADFTITNPKVRSIFIELLRSPEIDRMADCLLILYGLERASYSGNVAMFELCKDILLDERTGVNGKLAAAGYLRTHTLLVEPKYCLYALRACMGMLAIGNLDSEQAEQVRAHAYALMRNLCSEFRGKTRHELFNEIVELALQNVVYQSTPRSMELLLNLFPRDAGGAAGFCSAYSRIASQLSSEALDLCIKGALDQVSGLEVDGAPPLAMPAMRALLTSGIRQDEVISSLALAADGVLNKLTGEIKLEKAGLAALQALESMALAGTPGAYEAVEGLCATGVIPPERFNRLPPRPMEKPYLEMLGLALDTGGLGNLVDAITKGKPLTGVKIADLPREGRVDLADIAKTFDEQVMKQLAASSEALGEYGRHRPSMELISNGIDARLKGFTGDYFVDLRITKDSFTVEDRGKAMDLKTVLTSLMIPFIGDKERFKDIGRFGVGFLSNLHYCVENPRKTRVVVETYNGADQAYRFTFFATGKRTADLMCRVEAIEKREIGTTVSVQGLQSPPREEYVKLYYEFFDEKRALIRLNGKVMNRLGWEERARTVEWRKAMEFSSEEGPVQQEVRATLMPDERGGLCLYGQGVFLGEWSFPGLRARVDFPPVVEPVEGRTDLIRTEENYKKAAGFLLQVLREYVHDFSGDPVHRDAARNALPHLNIGPSFSKEEIAGFREKLFRGRVCLAEGAQQRRALDFFGEEIADEIFVPADLRSVSSFWGELNTVKEIVEGRVERTETPDFLEKHRLNKERAWVPVKLNVADASLTPSPFLLIDGLLYVNVEHELLKRKDPIAEYALDGCLNAALGKPEKELEGELDLKTILRERVGTFG